MNAPAPHKPKIYHITHVENLASIISDNWILCEEQMEGRTDFVNIGIQEIKSDRLSLPVHCHPDTFVGQYVPFYFCPRSTMLFVIHKANHPKLAYREGQKEIVHLEADLRSVVEWAGRRGCLWAFTTMNAACRAADFHSSLDELSLISWSAVAARDWAACRDEKQAEFLLHGGFPWSLVERIGVYSEAVGSRAHRSFGDSDHRPSIEVMRSWYY